MIDALNTASQGLLKAESRATDLAAEIIKATGQAASFKLEDASGDAAPNAAVASSAPIAGPSGAGYSDVLQHIADLKAEQASFKANAHVFKSLDETYDEALGSLFDEKG